ncbi:hypothetical protein [Streptomyces sp. NPDC056049]|uniref:hypothetical protein n=1 Tax=Streptomyces sp. NPDC056049 TaxID=3345693 RepID=UPI0035DCEF56
MTTGPGYGAGRIRLLPPELVSRRDEDAAASARPFLESPHLVQQFARVLEDDGDMKAADQRVPARRTALRDAPLR